MIKPIAVVPFTFGDIMILSLFLKASVNALVLAVPTAEFNNNMGQSLVWAV